MRYHRWVESPAATRTELERSVMDGSCIETDPSPGCVMYMYTHIDLYESAIGLVLTEGQILS